MDCCEEAFGEADATSVPRTATCSRTLQSAIINAYAVPVVRAAIPASPAGCRLQYAPRYKYTAGVVSAGEGRARRGHPPLQRSKPLAAANGP